MSWRPIGELAFCRVDGCRGTPPVTSAPGSQSIPSIAAVIAVVAGAAMVFFGRRGAKA